MKEQYAILDEIIIPWLEDRSEELSDAGFDTELSFREIILENGGHGEENLRPGLFFPGKRKTDYDSFMTLVPCEIDEGLAFILFLSLEKDINEKERSIRTWRIPLLMFPKLTKEDRDIFDLLMLFKTANGSGNSMVLSEKIHNGFYELPRINGLYDLLGGLGARPDMILPPDAPPGILIHDKDLVFLLSYSLIEEEDVWLLTARAYSAEGFTPENRDLEPLLRFDIPEYGGLLEPEAYGRLLEIMEAVL